LSPWIALDMYERVYRVVQKTRYQIYFFNNSFTVTSRNLWRVKAKFFHPPHLYCVTTLPCKTNTTANIGVKCLHFGRNVMLSAGVSRMGKTRVVFIDPGAKVNSSYYCNVVLEKGLLPDIRAIYRHYMWTLQQDGAPAHTAGPRWTIWKKSKSTSLNLTRGLRCFGCSSATSLPPTTVQDGGRTAASDSHRVAKTRTAFHW